MPGPKNFVGSTWTWAETPESPDPVTALNEALEDANRRAGLARMQEAEASEPVTWWWLSFADDDGFRGACVVEARGMIGAVQESHRRGINPGGQVAAIGLPPEAEVPESYRNRLLSFEDVEAMPGPDGEPSGAARIFGEEDDA